MRSAEYRVSAVTDQRPDLTVARRQDFVGKFCQAARADERGKFSDAAQFGWPGSEHAAHRYVALFDATPADCIEASRHCVQHMTQPLGKDAFAVVADSGMCNTHRGSSRCELSRYLFDFGNRDPAPGRKVDDIHFTDKRFQRRHTERARPRRRTGKPFA